MIQLTQPEKLGRDMDTLRQFTLWALASQGLQAKCEAGDAYTVVLPEKVQADFDGRIRLEFSFAESDEDAVDGQSATSLTFDSPLFEQIIARLNRLSPAARSAPAAQPIAVHELSQRLFDAYTIDGGNVHLAGCQFEEHPILRLSYWVSDQPTAAGVRHLFFTPEGKLLDDAKRQALCVDEVVPLRRSPEPVADEDVIRWIDLARSLSSEELNGEEASSDEASDGQRFLAATIVWCKYAKGKLAFCFGEKTAELDFSGWARRLADGSQTPPPYRCAATDRESYHLAVTDDGRITTRESLGVCSQSGRHVLVTELETCAATGKEALHEYMAHCEVSGDLTLKTELAQCPMCHQKVNPRSVDHSRCSACRSVQPVLDEDVRVQEVIAAYPGLATWSNWRLSETPTHVIMIGTRFLRRVLVVFDKRSKKAKRLAKGLRLGPNWTDASEDSLLS